MDMPTMFSIFPVRLMVSADRTRGISSRNIACLSPLGGTVLQSAHLVPQDVPDIGHLG